MSKRVTTAEKQAAASNGGEDPDANGSSGLERALSNTKPGTLAAAFVGLLHHQRLYKMKPGTQHYTRAKAAQIIAFFGADKDYNTFTRGQIEAYLMARREHRIVHGPVMKNIRFATHKVKIAKQAMKDGHTMYGAARIAKIELHQLRALLNPKPARYVSDVTIKKEVDVLFWALNVAAGHETHPFTGNTEALKLLRIEASAERTRTLTTAEFLKLYNVLSAERRDWLLVSVRTGARYGDIHRIEAKHIDHDSKRLYLISNKGVAKHRQRWVPLADDVYEMLKARAASRGRRPLFPHQPSCKFVEDPEKELCNCRATWRKALIRACKKAEIARCSANDLRRTFCTWMARAKYPESMVKTMMGHSPNSVMVQTVYRKYQEDEGRETIHLLPDLGIEAPKPKGKKKP
jgi:integrase